MLLISIHPFAFRRLALVILAVAGFSALCFADPVLMARKYTPGNHRTDAVKAAAAFLAPPSISTVATWEPQMPAAPVFGWRVSVVLEGATPSFSGPGDQHCCWRSEKLDGLSGEHLPIMGAD